MSSRSLQADNCIAKRKDRFKKIDEEFNELVERNQLQSTLGPETDKTENVLETIQNILQCNEMEWFEDQAVYRTNTPPSSQASCDSVVISSTCSSEIIPPTCRNSEISFPTNISELSSLTNGPDLTSSTNSSGTVTPACDISFTRSSSDLTVHACGSDIVTPKCDKPPTCSSSHLTIHDEDQSNEKLKWAKEKNKFLKKKHERLLERREKKKRNITKFCNVFYQVYKEILKKKSAQETIDSLRNIMINSGIQSLVSQDENEQDENDDEGSELYIHEDELDYADSDEYIDENGMTEDMDDAVQRFVNEDILMNKMDELNFASLEVFFEKLFRRDCEFGHDHDVELVWDNDDDLDSEDKGPSSNEDESVSEEEYEIDSDSEDVESSDEDEQLDRDELPVCICPQEQYTQL